MSNASPIKGYRLLSAEMVDLANRNKLIEELVLRQIDKMREDPGLDHRLISIAFTHFQEGFMSLNRAIFRPERIHGALDVEALVTELAQ